MKKKILYAFYHGSAFGWILAHRLTVHKNDDAYLMVSSAKSYHSLGYNMLDYLKRFVEAGLFQGIYTCNPLAGVDGRAFDTLNKSEKDISVHLYEEFKNQNFDLKSFDSIYNHTDGVDAFGIYLAINKIDFYWFEASKDANVFHIKRGFFSGEWYSNRRGYQAVVNKYKTILGENENETVILLPQSTKSIDYFRGKHSRIEFFDQNKAIEDIAPEYKKIILKLFGLYDTYFPEKAALILLQSVAEPEWRLDGHRKLKEKYSLIDYYCLHIQNVIDYFVPSGFLPILKQHPSISIESNLKNGMFGKAYAMPNMFTGVLMKLLDGKIRPKITLEANSSFKDISRDNINMKFYGVLHFPCFYHKYFLSIVIINQIGILAQDAGRHYRKIFREQDRALGKGKNFVMTDFVSDINSLVKLHFPKAPSSLNFDYEVVQEIDGMERLFDICQQRELVLYLDVWNEITKEGAIKLCDDFNVSIIKLEKYLLKSQSEVIDSLEDEYIFLISKNLEKVNAVKNLIIVKNNPTIGVKILCHSITLQQYLLEKQQNEEKEQMAVRIEKDKNFIKEIAASIRKVEDVITSNRVK